MHIFSLKVFLFILIQPLVSSSQMYLTKVSHSTITAFTIFDIPQILNESERIFSDTKNKSLIKRNLLDQFWDIYMDLETSASPDTISEINRYKLSCIVSFDYKPVIYKLYREVPIKKNNKFQFDYIIISTYTDSIALNSIKEKYSFIYNKPLDESELLCDTFYFRPLTVTKVIDISDSTSLQSFHNSFLTSPILEKQLSGLYTLANLSRKKLKSIDSLTLNYCRLLTKRKGTVQLISSGQNTTLSEVRVVVQQILKRNRYLEYLIQKSSLYIPGKYNY